MATEELKYRPSFTKQEIAYIIDLCNLDTRPATTEMAFTIACRLKVFSLKADLNIVSPAFSSAPKQSLEEKLGMESESPSQKRQAAFAKWKLNPALCNSFEIGMANTYRYENGLMTAAEENEYES